MHKRVFVPWWREVRLRASAAFHLSGGAQDLRSCTSGHQLNASSLAMLQSGVLCTAEMLVSPHLQLPCPGRDADGSASRRSSGTRSSSEAHGMKPSARISSVTSTGKPEAESSRN